MSISDTLVSCGQCRKSVRIFDSKPKPNSDEPQTVTRALQCGHCGRACCVACQRSDQPCSCGQRNWKKAYFVEVRQSWWQKLLGG